jgi:hypothetical protein
MGGYSGASGGKRPGDYIDAADFIDNCINKAYSNTQLVYLAKGVGGHLISVSL